MLTYNSISSEVIFQKCKTDTLTDKQNLKVFIASRSVLQEMIKSPSGSRKMIQVENLNVYKERKIIKKIYEE